MNLVIPSRSESTALFWTGIVLGVIVLAILIYAFVEIFTHKSIVYDEEKHKFSYETVGLINPPVLQPTGSAIPTIAITPNSIVPPSIPTPFEINTFTPPTVFAAS